MSSLRFYSARCGKETVDPDKALQPVMLPFMPKSGNQAFDIVTSYDVTGNLRSTSMSFKEVGWALKKSEDGQDDEAGEISEVEKILSTIVGVIVPDIATEGRSLKFMSCLSINGIKCDDIPLTAPLPSNRPIRALQRIVLPHYSTTTATPIKGKKKDRSDNVSSPLSYLVADSTGNVYLINNIYISHFDDVKHSPKTKGRRLEASASPPNANYSLAHAVLVVRSSDIEPMHGAIPHYRTPSQSGWIGLAFPAVCYEDVNATCSAHGIPRLFNNGATKSEFMIGREIDNDVRRIVLSIHDAPDTVISDIHLTVSAIESYYPAHGPLSLTYCGDFDQFAAVADGSLVTIFGLSSLSSSDAPTRTPIHQIDSRDLVWGVGSLSSTILPIIKFIQSDMKYKKQLDATIENLKNCLIFCCSDRSVNIFDTRKWTKVNVIQNSLKYDAMSIAPICCLFSSYESPVLELPAKLLSSFSLVVGGIDTEVRCIPCFEGSSFAIAMSTTSDGKHSSKGTAKKQTKAIAAAHDTVADSCDIVSEPLVSSFRGRLTSAIHGDHVWYGGWRTSWIPTTEGRVKGALGALSVAVGLSSTGQLYVVTV